MTTRFLALVFLLFVAESNAEPTAPVTPAPTRTSSPPPAVTPPPAAPGPTMDSALAAGQAAL